MENVMPDFKKWSAIREEFEGFENEAYLDSGKVWTIGTGFTYNYDKGRKVQKGDIISRETNTRWNAIALDGYVKDANRYIKVKLDPDQSTAVCDYIYNRGIGNFLKTQLDELINANSFDVRIKQEFCKTGLWDRAGNLLWGLGRRRRAQAYLYFTGQLKFEWPRWGSTF